MHAFVLSLGELFLEWPLSLLGAWLLERAVRRFLPGKTGWLSRAARFALLLASTLGPMWIGDENLLFLFAAFVLVFLLCYHGSAAARLTICVTFYLLVATLGMILDTWMNFMPSSAWHWAETGGWLIKTAAAAAVYLLARKLNPAGKPLSLPNRLWGLCGLLALAPLFTVLSFSLWNSNIFPFGEMDLGQYRIAFTILPFVLISALALLAAPVVLSRQQALEQENRLAGMRELYYENLRREETQIRALRHDLRNHLTAAAGLLDAGEVENARAYLGELTDSPALHGGRRVCENETANAVLAAKIGDMEKAGLTAEVLAVLPAELNVADTDLAALLGNALDNAMEAAALAADKRVTVRLRADRGMLMLRVENACARPPEQTDGKFSTTKQNKAAHGFGVPGMQEIAERYGGTLEARTENGRFELVACLPLAEKKRESRPLQ